MVPDWHPRRGCCHLSSAKPPLEQAEVIIATGLRGNALQEKEISLFVGKSKAWKCKRI